MADGPVTEDELDQRISRLYGRIDWASATGIVQVCAIGARERAVIAMGVLAPKSATDRFILGFARARADVIVTTGAILRSEPGLTHCYAEDPGVDAALRSWRKRALGRTTEPAVVVLSGSGKFPVDHSAIDFARGGFVWTSRSGREGLGSKVGRLSVEFDPSGSSDIDDLAQYMTGAIALARSRLSAEMILIEAGPRLSRVLYPNLDDPSNKTHAIVDELLLSQFMGDLGDGAVGPPFLSPEFVHAVFAKSPVATEMHEASGLWRFERYRREDGNR